CTYSLATYIIESRCDISLFSSSCCGNLSDLHSFPTRRSSDLYILGQWCNAEGLIFRQIADDKERFITDKPLETGIISIGVDWGRSEEHTSELQSRFDLVCRLLLEKKKNKTNISN